MCLCVHPGKESLVLALGLPSHEKLAKCWRELTNLFLLLLQLSLGLLVTDFGAMVNNPHLSDVQFQLDSGEVLYAHKFVLYARCPLLIQYVSTQAWEPTTSPPSPFAFPSLHLYLHHCETPDHPLSVLEHHILASVSHYRLEPPHRNPAHCLICVRKSQTQECLIF